MKTRYAIIGAGSRSQMYIDAIVTRYAAVAQLVAICEPNPVRARWAAELATRGSDAPRVWSPDDLEEMIREDRIDRVIITARDDLHAPLIVRALRAGARVVVEKPLTIDASSARAIEAAVADAPGDVVMTFNYRYSPRNSILRRVVKDGLIGEVTSVDFQWMLDTKHGADYFRRWHRRKEHSGGLLVHKASHHFDLVNWWISSVAHRVYAAGGLRFYGEDNAASRGLATRPERGTHNGPRDPFELDLRQHPLLKRLYLDAEAHDGYVRDLDVFGRGITIEDNLALIVEYGSGAILNYSLNAHSPWEGYRVAINGTGGRVELDVVERGAVTAGEGLLDVIDPSVEHSLRSAATRPESDRLVLQRHWETAVEIPIPEDAGGHGGGDARLLDDVFLGTDGDDLGRAADWRDGLRSIAIGVAGNRSLQTRMPVEISDLGIALLAAGH